MRASQVYNVSGLSNNTTRAERHTTQNVTEKLEYPKKAKQATELKPLRGAIGIAAHGKRAMASSPHGASAAQGR